MGMKQGFKQTEISVIPEDWEIKDFGKVGNYYKGGGISMKDVRPIGLPCIMYGDIYVKFDTHFKKCDYHIDSVIAKNSVKASPQDLFFTASGETADDIGRCVSYQGEDDIYIGGDIIALHPSDEYDSLFLAYVQNSEKVKKQKASFAQGHSVVHISADNIKKTLFAAPKYPEQKRIAEALSDVDELIESLEKLIEKKKALKQGVMQELLTGKRRLPGFTGNWKKDTLVNCCNIYRGGSPRPIQDYITLDDSGVNWIKIGDVAKGDKFIFSTEEKITESGALLSRRVHSNDLILSNSMSFGRPYILKINGCIHDGWLVIQDYVDVFDTEFLYYTLGSNYILFQYQQMSAGSSVQNLNKEMVSKLQIVFPGIIEQRKITSILSEIDYEIDSISKKLSKAEQIKSGMMSELLTGKIRLM